MQALGFVGRRGLARDRVYRVKGLGAARDYDLLVQTHRAS